MKKVPVTDDTSPISSFLTPTKQRLKDNQFLITQHKEKVVKLVKMKKK